MNGFYFMMLNVDFLKMNNMKTIQFLATLIITFILLSCNNRDSITQLELKYTNAKNLNDHQTAIKYLHDILFIEPDNNSAYYRLSGLYSKTKNYGGVIIAADSALSKANEFEKKVLLREQWKAYQAINKNEKAINILNKLIKIDTDLELEHRYSIATLYYISKKHEDALLKLNEILLHPNASKIKKEVSSDYGNEMVNYKIASLNFMGFIKMQEGKLNDSENYYKELFKSTIDFKLAKNNYILLKQQQAKKLKTK